MSEAEARRLEARARLEVERLAPAFASARAAAASNQGVRVDERHELKLVVAVSGGGDSVAALHLLKRAGFGVVAAHYDHRLRPESAEDASFVRQLCSRLDVPLVQSGADVQEVASKRGWNLEDAARRLRYSFLYKVLANDAPGGVIVVAHTLEDQAETVLLQLLRGAAYPVGMSPRQRGVIRPLLGERRRVLRAYLTLVGEPWVEDVTNSSIDRNRVWLRNHLIPQAEQRYPTVQERLARTATVQQEARAALVSLAKRRFPDAAIRLAAYRVSPPALRKTALAHRLRTVGAAPNATLVDEIDSRALAAAEGYESAPWRISLPGGGEAEIAYGTATFRSAPPDEVQMAAVEVTAIEQLPADVDPGVLQRYPKLQLRSPRSGDRISMPGGRKLLSDVLIDLKVPRASRAALRVLAVDATGEGAEESVGEAGATETRDTTAGAEVLWVEGTAVALGAGKPGVPNLLDPDRHFMHLALKQARLAERAGEVPIGAVVVSRAGEVLSEAHNQTESTGDPTAHAEVVALRRAALAAEDWRLAGATLYVTLEPCPMCLGAVLQTHLAKVVFGANNRRDGALGGVTDLSGEGWKRVPAIRGGVEAAQAEKLLRGVFEAKRRAPERL